jgi:hypothetical protein
VINFDRSKSIATTTRIIGSWSSRSPRNLHDLRDQGFVPIALRLVWMPLPRARPLGTGMSMLVAAASRPSGTNSAQERTINDGKRCQTLAEFPLVEVTMG